MSDVPSSGSATHRTTKDAPWASSVFGEFCNASIFVRVRDGYVKRYQLAPNLIKRLLAFGVLVIRPLHRNQYVVR